MFGSSSHIISDGITRLLDMINRNEIERSKDIVTAEPEIEIYPLSNGLFCFYVVI